MFSEMASAVLTANACWQAHETEAMAELQQAGGGSRQQVPLGRRGQRFMCTQASLLPTWRPGRQLWPPPWLQGNRPATNRFHAKLEPAKLECHAGACTCTALQLTTSRGRAAAGRLASGDHCRGEGTPGAGLSAGCTGSLRQQPQAATTRRAHQSRLRWPQPWQWPRQWHVLRPRPPR